MRTSGSWSTSDPAPARWLGLVRLIHPFPSALDGLVVLGVAAVAGAPLPDAIRLGLSMTALQASIGALNDIIDAPSDEGGKPAKPIPSGLVARPLARAVVIVAAAVGIGLAIPGGIGLVALAVLGLGIGIAYDLVAKGTAWSWLPFALGIPLLPVYGWYGATSSLPGWFVVLVPMAAVAGAALAVANAWADLERDREAGTTTIATALGDDRSRWAVAGLWATAGTIAVVSGAAGGGSPAQLVAIAVGLGVVVVGIAIGHRAAPARRELAWEVQAVGAAITATAWVLAVA
ncbi:MAG: UbiA family prenyltransferase [Chloroflexota bacterium]|nr:UbiA family prenyltransferase [Chloroflexota bacterium]